MDFYRNNLDVSITRYSKIVLISVIFLYSLLVVFNNVFDYWSNFEFVRHVLAMDTTFPENNGMWRAVPGNFWHHFAYLSIIFVEVVIAFLAAVGLVGLWRARRDVPAFERAKTPAIAALIFGVLLWFGGFIVIGGEWFLMWQSQIWNGSPTAFPISVFFLVALLFLSQKDG
jgi:predicted small integral membrane protein